MLKVAENTAMAGKQRLHYRVGEVFTIRNLAMNQEAEVGGRRLRSKYGGQNKDLLTEWII